jgi:ABC-type phosphate transport system auxiliary subunit
METKASKNLRKWKEQDVQPIVKALTDLLIESNDQRTAAAVNSEMAQQEVVILHNLMEKRFTSLNKKIDALSKNVEELLKRKTA